MYIQYKKPSAEKKLPPNVGSLKSNSIRKWCLNYHSHPPRRRSSPLIKKKTALEEVIGEPLSGPITIQVANIRGKLFLSRGIFILDSDINS